MLAVSCVSEPPFMGSLWVPVNRVLQSSSGAQAKNAPRPKRIKGQLKEDLLSKLAEGASKQVLCDEFKITVSTINKLLRAHPATYAIALEARQRREIDERRSQWQHLHKLYPELGVQALRNTMPSLYAWLYRNDKDWLMAEEQTFAKPEHVNTHHIDWEARDYRLLSMLHTACESIALTQRGPVTMTLLYAMIPMLSTCLENRDRYRESRAYLSTIQGRSKPKDLFDNGEGINASKRTIAKGRTCSMAMTSAAKEGRNH
ncbi:TnsD family Tn7-like transposition protein [Pseudomonas chlororaphis]|uniref:TnsD family Tn7-like transposition protein n=1 Tax=Pseudomonas chlororaphis TaxID=587753 RepID=UPI003B75CF80